MTRGYKTTDEAWKVWTPAEVKKYKVAMYQHHNGLYEAFVARVRGLPAGTERMSPQPPYPHSADPREGTKKAMQQLEAKYPDQIGQACRVAVKIAKRKLTVHSREVREEMERQGLVGPDTGAEFWLGPVFGRLVREKILSKTGQKYKYSDPARGIHEREVTIWQLVDGADTKEYET